MDVTPSHSEPGRDFTQIVPGRVAVPRDQSDAVSEFLQQEPLSVDALLEQLGWDPEDDGSRAFLEEYVERVAVYVIDAEGAATYETIGAIRAETGAAARPMFWMTVLNHMAGMPSGDPEQTLSELEDAKSFATATECGGLKVYVIDSGFVKNHAWKNADGFNAGRVGGLDASDESSAGNESHGTFVACVIGAISPHSEVRVLAVNLSDPVEADAPEAKVHAEELAVARAIKRVEEQPDEGKAVLNLSFGAYPLEIENERGEAEEIFPVDLEQGLRSLAAAKPEMVVIAAAGNQFPHPGEVFRLPYPAGFDRVVSVGAMDRQDRWVLWPPAPVAVSGRRPAEGEPGIPGTWESLVDRLAPGIDLIAPAGGERLIRWSGSSFATAVQSGVTARDGRVVDATRADYPFFG